MLNNKHIVKEGQSLDLHRLLDTNKVYLKDIFESDNETLQQQINHYNGIDHPFEFGGNELTIDNLNLNLILRLICLIL